jgi:hypothetical protein
MAAVHEIAARLATALSLTVGTNLFRDVLPETTVLAGVIAATGGLAPEHGFGFKGVDFERPAFQVVFRGLAGEVDAPRAKAQQAFDDLAKVEAETLSAGGGGTSAFYHWIHPQQSPFLFKKDEQDRYYYAFNVLCEKEPSA